MSKTIDKDGRIQVFSFIVDLPSAGARIQKYFTDYADGWNWAREEKEAFEEAIGEEECKISWDYTWVLPEDMTAFFD